MVLHTLDGIAYLHAMRRRDDAPSLRAKRTIGIDRLYRCSHTIASRMMLHPRKFFAPSLTDWSLGDGGGVSAGLTWHGGEEIKMHGTA